MIVNFIFKSQQFILFNEFRGNGSAKQHWAVIQNEVSEVHFNLSEFCGEQRKILSRRQGFI